MFLQFSFHDISIVSIVHKDGGIIFIKKQLNLFDRYGRRNMEHIKFKKTLCGVELLLNVLDYDNNSAVKLSQEQRTTDFFQMVFLVEASGELELNGESIPLKRQSVLFISKGQGHQWRLDDKAAIKVRILVFQDDFLNEFFADPHFTYRLLYFYQNRFPLYLPVSGDEFSSFMHQLSEMKEELVVPKTDSAHLIRSILYYLLILLNRRFAHYNKIDIAISINHHAYVFRKLVEDHIHEWQRIDDYTSAMGVSRITLNKAVKDQFNETASEFIKSKLIFEIKMKLMYSELTIGEIANALNFSEPNHLTRLFKNREGITPVEFRAGKSLDS